MDGYLVANDVSGRDLQFGRPVGTRKSSTRSCRCRPGASSAVPDLRHSRQGDPEPGDADSRRRTVFSVADVVSFISQAITLEPGDLIITGTPAGVGAFRDPPMWLTPGDEITIEIDGVGSITNPVTG
jgi:2-keto-4-pentenoate hydratase/2-oxohepta-3-ene-1,7-dioic acid hydratase in catechol pathway